MNSDAVLETERLNGGRIKGSVIRAHLEWVCEHGTREETIEFFETLPAPVRQTAMSVLAAAWYPFATLIEIDRVIAWLFGENRPSFLEELGRYSAQRNLASVPAMLHRGDPHECFRRISMLHRDFQDFGTARYVVTSACSGVMEHSEYPSFSPLYCASAAGFYREAIRMHRRSEGFVRELACQCHGDAECRFELSWK